MCVLKKENCCWGAYATQLHPCRRRRQAPAQPSLCRRPAAARAACGRERPGGPMPPSTTSPSFGRHGTGAGASSAAGARLSVRPAGSLRAVSGAQLLRAALGASAAPGTPSRAVQGSGPVLNLPPAAPHSSKTIFDCANLSLCLVRHAQAGGATSGPGACVAPASAATTCSGAATSCAVHQPQSSTPAHSHTHTPSPPHMPTHTRPFSHARRSCCTSCPSSATMTCSPWTSPATLPLRSTTSSGWRAACTAR